MCYYAQIDEKGYCMAVSDLGEAVEREDMIPIPEMEMTYLNRKYDKEQGIWTEEWREEKPVSELQPTNKEILESITGLRQEVVPYSGVARTMFVTMAQTAALEDTTIAAYPELFLAWDEHWTGKAGSIVREEGQLYRAIHDVGAGQNTKPSQTPAMWTRIGNPEEEYPEWIQPLGVHDAYEKGAKVTHTGEQWVSEVDGNVWEPGVYGWGKGVE